MYDFLLVGNCKDGCMLYHFQLTWRWIIVILKGHWRSFKLVPFESLGVVSYSPSIVTMAVSLTVYEYSTSKYSVTLKTGLGVVQASRSLKMAPFDRPYTTFYWSAIVNIARSGTVLSYLTLSDIVTLKSGLKVTQGHSNWYHSKAWVWFLIRFP